MTLDTWLVASCLVSCGSWALIAAYYRRLYLREQRLSSHLLMEKLQKSQGKRLLPRRRMFEIEN